MSGLRKFFVVALTALGMAAAGQSAQATPNLAQGPIALSGSETFTLGNLQFTINSCTSSKNPGACTGDGVTTGVQISAAGSNGIKLAGPSGGTLETTASAGYGNGYDITLNFTVTSLNSSYLDGVNLALTGSGNYTHASATLQVPAGAGAVSTSPETDGTVATTVGAGPTVPSSSQQISLDFFAGGLNSPGSISSLTVAVPEPTSMLLLGGGVAALAALRRKRRNPAN